MRLNKPHGFANPASFDYEAWLFQQAIVAKGYVRSSTDNRLLAAHSRSITSIRSRLRIRVQAAVADLNYGGIILALILGDRSGISQTSWQKLSDTGINHLFVISGLHIGLIAVAVFWLADKFIRLLPAILLRLPAQKFGAILAIMAVLSFAALLFLLPRGVGNRWLALPLCLPLFSPLPDKFEPPSLKLHFLDVGQGLAVVVQSRHHVLIYDTGANLSPDFNIGRAVIAPYLNRLGIERVDLVVISHADNDHAGGLSGLLENIEIGAITSSGVNLGVTMAIKSCYQFEGWNWDQVEFRFLGSFVDAASDNDNSCVLQIAVGKHRILLPGDIERFRERQLAIDYGDTLRSTILAAPHHGSKTSSSYAFIKMVSPEVVVFSAGYRNSFGHPHREIVARYRLSGARVLNTSDTGMISFSFDTESTAMVTSLYRQRWPRYWR